jgi:hypothetical protein
MSTALVHEPAVAGFAGRVARPEPANRRRSQRLSAGDVQWLQGARLKYGPKVRIIDISSGGMLVETETPLRPGAKMVFELSGADGPVLVPCRVLRSAPANDGGGAAFRSACAFIRPLTIPEVAHSGLGAAVASGIVAGLDALSAERAAARAAEPRVSDITAAGVAWQKVIVRYADGQIRRGYTNNFTTDRAQLHLSTNPCSGEMVLVPLARLKALFFVREFGGDPGYVERQEFTTGAAGRKVEVTFHDGERLVGSTVAYRSEGTGFFLIPADPRSNNLRVFVIHAAVRHVRFI